MRTIAALLAGLAVALPLRADEASEPAVKTAVEKALKRLEAGVTNYPKHRQCFSCHHQAMAVLAMTAAQQRGFAVDAELLKKVIDFSLRSFRNKTLISRGQGVGGDSVSIVYALHTFAAVDRPYDDTIAAMVDYLLVKQRRDGAWPVPFGGDRPPTMGSLYTQTGLAMYALKRYGPPSGKRRSTRPSPGGATGCWPASPAPPRTRCSTCAAWWTPASRPRRSRRRASSC
jgi:N-acyl-D-amino-acid deacylase